LASKPEAKWALLDKQVAQATSLLRQMRDTIEDIEDARTIERVKKVHGQKPRVNVSRQYQHPERMAITQPRVARHELPWEHASKVTCYPERVISACAQASGTAVVERDSDTGLLVGYVPGFPGARSQAESLDELQANLREVIAMLLEDGEPRLEAEFVGTQSIAVA
jgi:predicted RNase H-like HicB family nuclease